MSNNNTPSKTEAVEALDQLARHLAPYGVSARNSFTTLRAFISGAPDAANAGEPAAFRRPVADIARGALEAIEAGDRAPILMNVEGIKANLRSLIATPTGVAADESTRAPVAWLEFDIHAADGEFPWMLMVNKDHPAIQARAPIVCFAPPSGERPSAPAPSDAKDAARYRWLRDVSVPPHNFYISVPDEFGGVRYSAQEVDAYIDAAMGAPAPEGEKREG